MVESFLIAALGPNLGPFAGLCSILFGGIAVFILAAYFVLEMWDW